MGLKTTARVPVSYVLNNRNAHYVFYCDFAGATCSSSQSAINAKYV